MVDYFCKLREKFILVSWYKLMRLEIKLGRDFVSLTMRDAFMCPLQ